MAFILGGLVKELPDQYEDLLIECPLCGEETVGEPFVVYEETRIFYVLPIRKRHFYYVRCAGCGGKLISKVPVKELYGLTRKELKKELKIAGNVLGAIYAIAGLVFGIVPLAGGVICVAGLIYNRKRFGWRLVCGVLGLLFQLVSIYFMMNLSEPTM